MPRRKQGQSKEIISAADHEKKSETVGEIVQNEVPEKPPALKEWKSKNKKQGCTLTFSSAIDHNGKTETGNAASDSSRSVKHLDKKKDGDWHKKDLSSNNKRETSKNNGKLRTLDKYNNLSKKRNVEIQNECCLTVANVENLNSVDKLLSAVSTHIKNDGLQKVFPCSVGEELNAKSYDHLVCSSNNELLGFKVSNKNDSTKNESRFADSSLTSITVCTSSQATYSCQSDLKELSIPKSSAYSTCNQKSSVEISAQNLEFNNGNNMKENKCITNDRIGKCIEVNMSSQMSGLSPAIITTTHQGNHAEVLQLNYRVSTSVIETKSSSLNGRYVPTVSSSETCKVLDNKSNCQLPSSVYGTSASNIETVLTGLHLFDNEKSKASKNYSLMPLKGSFLQEILEDQNISEQSYVKLKDNSDQDREEKTENKITLSPDVQPLKPCAEGFKFFNPKHEMDKKESDIISEIQSSKLKLHIPELSSAEDSDSSQQQSAEISKSLKFPKITSPQILEQHISKIISENAAIVETLDPLWSRRYLRQSSITSSQNVDAEIKKSSTSTRIRRYSDDKLPLSSSPDQICHSKLQSALLGSLESEQNSSQSSNLSTSLQTSSSGTNSLIQLNNSTVPAVGIFSKISNCSVSEEELQGSAVKSLLSLKQGKYSKQKNSFFFNKEMCNKHPQNPEGSIIKDLLLKTRSKGNHDFSPGCEGQKLQHTATTSSSDFYNISDNKLDDIHSLVYLCTNCGSRCRTKESLDVHITHCKGAKELTFAISNNDKNIDLFSNNYTQSQSISKEKLNDNFPTILNPSLRGCSDVHEVFKVETAASVNLDDAIGHILKKQLLSPLSSQSPPLKKRKISEPVISMNKLEDFQVYQANDVISINKSVSLPRQLDGISISPHRCRSQSVHLFGGEVQILDGVQTKKLKITTSLQGAFPLATNSLSNDFSFRKMPVMEENAIDLHNSSLPTVVVTIAQPVHNSGGTVMHVHKLTPSSSLSPVVTVSNHLISAGIEKFSELGNPSINSFSVSATKCDSPTFPIFPIDKKVENSRNNHGTNRINNEPLSSYTESSLPGSLYTTGSLNSVPNSFISDFTLSVPQQSSSPVIARDFKTSQSEKLNFTSKSVFFPEKERPLQNMTSAIEQETSLFENKASKEPISTCSYNNQVFLPQSSSEVQSTQSRIIPTVTLTPSSPTFLSSGDKELEKLECLKSDNSKKFLAPSRPTSLPLKKKPFTMVGSTLISPETPRPKKSCVQLYLNGHAYTYLGLKCSTRSTYCCIYRPQPMYVPQDNNSKLSMYSNWQVVPAKEELSGLTPGQMISYYDSRQRFHSSDPLFSMTKLAEPLSFTHSSYWVFRTKDQEKIEPKEEINEHQGRVECPNIEKKDASNCSLEHTQNASMDSSVMIEPSVPADSVDDILKNNKEDGRPSSAAESSQDLDGSAALSGVEENGTYDDDDDDYQEDGAESVTDSSLPQPPKRVKIFEGGFKSNEDYTYVRGRGRGKYVCEECGIRCKKPSMLKKHIRTHTDLRPYKCRHCSFAFKTKGNLTKHMKSKAHHKKCTELGIVPVPTTTDDSQIDEDALAKQEQLERKNPQFSDGEEADDDDDDELDDDLEDSDGLDDDCESDSGIMSSNQKSRSLTNGHSRKCDSLENTCDEQFEDSSGEKADHPSQRIVEQEAAHSLLHLSALNEPSQWSTSTGEMTDVTTSSHSETENTSASSVVLGNTVGPVSPHKIPTVVTNAIAPVSVKMNADQSSVLWLSPEPLGHRPRSYSADIPYTGNREQHDRFQHSSDISFESSEIQTREQSELGSREHYGRRYSISVTSEARKPARVLQPPNWSNSGFSNLNKWPEMEASDQPMDLRISRGNVTDKPKQEYHIAISSSSALTVAPQEDNALETHIQLSPETCLSEHYQQKLLPVLSPQALPGYDSGGDNSSSDAGLANVAEEHQSYNTSIFLPRTSILYMPDASIGDTQLARKEMEVTDDQPSPEALDYAACSPVTPPPIDENYYYPQENLVGSHSSISPEEMPPSSRGHHAEFIVPSTSSGLEEGRCICRICNKIFFKSSQLRLHVNIHYFERPFRCDNCAVSFRTKGHLQKHKRSVSHYNKVNMNMTFGTPTVDNPRPFKCADCKIAFRIHGHLAKHLRSKMHIMKLECLGKLPFGMYAEMERSGVSLNEIDTTDCNNSLESLQVMAQRLYQRDPRRMRWHNPDHTTIDPESAKSTTPLPPVADTVAMSELPVNSYTQPCAIGIPAPSMLNMNQNVNSGSEVKQEPSELEVFRTTSSFSDGESPVSPHHYSVNQSVGEIGQETPRRLETEGDSEISLHRSCTCHLCGRLFKSAKFLQVHLYCDHVGWNPPSSGEVPQEPPAGSPSHSTVAQNLICDLCGKHFSNQNILQQHLLSHAQPRPFVCEVCDAGFTSSALLVAHLATHEQMGASGCSEATLVQLR